MRSSNATDVTPRRIDRRLSWCDAEFVAQQSESHQIDQVVTRLSATYPTVSQTRVVEVVRTVHADFDGRPLREFVPLFVERRAKQELSQLSA